MYSIQSIIHFLREVFIDTESRESIQGSQNIHSLQEHYQQELQPWYLDDVIVATTYESIKKELEAYKYRSERHSGKGLVQYYIDIFRQHVRHGEDDEWVVVPVPMHWSRYIIRWFDHILYLANLISNNTDISVQRILETRYRPRQSQLNRTSRLANKKNAFRIKNGITSIPKKVILLDDVISSGSTANACAQVLKEAGVEEVIGYFIASNN